MRRWKGKTFTFFLLCLSLLFLLTAPPLLSRKLEEQRSEDLFEMEKPEWTGVITLWDIPYVQTGKGNAVRWLAGYISRFEKKYPGVFIDVRTLTTERLAMYLQGAEYQDFLPDMVSLGIYEQPVPEELLMDLLPSFQPEELAGMYDIAVERVMSGDRMIGVPWMMGSYGLAVKEEAFSDTDPASVPEILDYEALDALARKMSFQKKSGRKMTDYYGFCSYTGCNRPLLSMIYGEDGKITDNAGHALLAGWKEGDGILPPDLAGLSYSQAFRLFAVEKRAGVLLGSSRMIYDLRNLQQSGKGLEYRIFPVPMKEGGKWYQDQIAAYGILDHGSPEKTQLCTLFLKGLLEEEVQMQLTDLGLFSVMEAYTLYGEDEEMKILESALTQMAAGPFGEDRDRINTFWERWAAPDPAD